MRGVALAVTVAALAAAAAAAATAAAAVLAAAPPAAAPPAAVRLSLDGRAALHTFDGHGALSAGASSRLLLDYAEPQRSQILDALFTPGVGAALHVLKLEIGGDHQATDGAEPSHSHFRGDLGCDRGYEVWLAREARRRNPAVVVYAMPWNAPRWVGDGGGGGLYGVPDGVAYRVAWAECLRDFGGGAPALLGLWNEQSQPSSSFVIALRDALDAAGLNETRIVVSECPPGTMMASIRNAQYTPLLSRSRARAPLLPNLPAVDGQYNASQVAEAQADPAFASAVYAAGLHYPCLRPEPAVEALGWRYWASEDNSRDPAWELGGRYFGKALSQNYVLSNFTSTVSWSLTWSAYDNLICAEAGLMRANDPFSGHYSLEAPIFMLAHWSRFGVAPGWRFLSVSSGSSGQLFAPQGGNAAGSFVTLVPPEGPGAGFALIVETLQSSDCCARGAHDLALSVSLDAGLPNAPGTALRVWQSTKGSYLVRMPDAIVDANGSFTLTVAADSIVTVTTRDATPPPPGWTPPGPPPAPAPFLPPYADDFPAAAYAYDALPRFFADQSGAFAVRNGSVVQAADGPAGPNGCLPEYAPVSIFGNVNWTDLVVGVSIVFEAAADEGRGRLWRDGGTCSASGNGGGGNGACSAAVRVRPSARERERRRASGLADEHPLVVPAPAPAPARQALPDVHARLCGRIGTFPGFNWNLLPQPGFCFVLAPSGAWWLTANETALLNGSIAAFDPTRPHALALSLRGASIGGSVDGASVGAVEDARFPQGSVAIGCGWGAGDTRFESFFVDP